MRAGDLGRILVLISVAYALGGCSDGSSASRPAPADGAIGTAAAQAATVPVPEPLPLGKPALADFGFRRGSGRAAYERARAAEKLAREDADWQVVVDACAEARRADPGHLDAAWLEAAALARLGRHEQILAPLSVAVAGDWAKWGERSLTLPLFEAFLASPAGAAWRSLAQHYRGAFAAAARRALVLLGRDGAPDAYERRGEIVAWDPEADRWLRLTRTGGTAVASLPAPTEAGLVAYVAYRDLGTGDRQGALARPRIAVIELATGLVSREIALAGVSSLTLAWRPGPTPGDPLLVVSIDGGKEAGLWTLDWKRGHKKRPAAKSKLTVGRDTLVVARGQVRRRRGSAGITADWDDDGAASAIRLDATRRTVAPAEGLVVDGHALAWSPDRARLALVAVPEGECEAAATLIVVDAATGQQHPIGTAAAPAPTWVDATHVAYTDGERVQVVDVTGASPPRALPGAATAIVDRPCTPPDDEVFFALPPEDDELDAEPVPAAAANVVDAGVPLDASLP